MIYQNKKKIEIKKIVKKELKNRNKIKKEFNRYKIYLFKLD